MPLISDQQTRVANEGGDSNKLETMPREIPKLKCKEKKIITRMEQAIQDLWDNYKRYPMPMMGMPEDRKQGKKWKNRKKYRNHGD